MPFFLIPLLTAQTTSVPNGSGQTSPATPKSYPYCEADPLSFRIDSKAGDFNGMSHSGTMLVVRNNGKQPCEVGAIPNLTFADAKGKLNLQAQSELPRFVHPGPVVPPVVVNPGAEIMSSLRWVSGSVYPDSVCFDPTQVIISINGKPLQVPFQGHMCGERAKGVLYQVGRFAPKH